MYMFNIISGVKAFISGLQMQQKQSETTHKIVPGNIFKNFFKFVLEIVNYCLVYDITLFLWQPLIDVFNYTGAWNPKINIGLLFIYKFIIIIYDIISYIVLAKITSIIPQCSFQMRTHCAWAYSIYTLYIYNIFSRGSQLAALNIVVRGLLKND